MFLVVLVLLTVVAVVPTAATSAPVQIARVSRISDLLTVNIVTAPALTGSHYYSSGWCSPRLESGMLSFYALCGQRHQHRR